MEDEELVRLFREKGDRQAFEDLVRRHLPLIRRVLFAVLGGNEEDMADAEQETLVRLFLSLHKFKGKASFRTYFARLAKNTAVDEMRKIARFRKIRDRAETLEPRPDHGKDDPLDHIIMDEERQRVVHLLESLQPEERFVLYMKDAEDWSLEEISEATGLAVGTVKSKLHRSRKKFERLEKEIAYV